MNARKHIRLYVWLLLVGFLGATFAVAAWMAAAVGRSHVNLALDLEAPLDTAPVIRFGDGVSGQAVSMTLVPERFSQRVGAFEIQVTDRKNPLSRARHVNLPSFAGYEDARTSPPGAWTTTRWGALQFEETPSLLTGDGNTTPTLRWRGPLFAADLRLWMHRWAGIVKWVTAEGTRDIDLYSGLQEQQPFLVTVPRDGHYARYVASVPRAWLGDLRLVFAPGGLPEIKRLYVGTFVPTVYFGGRSAWPPGVWGTITVAWAPRWEGPAIALPPLSPWEQGRWRTLALAWVGVMGGWLALVAALWGGWRLARAAARRPVLEAERLGPWPWRAFFVFLLSIWGGGGVWLATFWPAFVPGDTWEQWDQVMQWKLQDTHPPFMALTLWAITRLWWTPSVLALAQMAALGAVCAWAFAFLVRVRVPKWAIGVAWGALLLSPSVGSLAITVIKDVPYSIAAVAITVLLAGLGLEPDRPRGWAWWAGLGVLLALLPLYRYNGLLVAPLLAGVLWVALPRSRRGLGKALTVAAVLYGLVRYGLFGWLQVTHSPYGFGTFFPVWTAAGVLTNGAPVWGADGEFLDRLAPLEAGWRYSPTVSTEAVFGVGLDKKNVNIPLAAAENARLWSVLARLSEHNGGVVLRNILRSTAYLYWVPRPAGAGEQVLLVHQCLMYEGSRRRMIAHGFLSGSYLPSLREAVARLMPQLIFDPPGGMRFAWLLWRPALRLYLVMAAACVVVWRRRPLLLLPFAPVFLNTVSLVMGLASETRYQLPLFLATGFLVCLALLPASVAKGEVPCPSSGKCVPGSDTGSAS